MKCKYNDCAWFVASALSFLLLSVSFLLMPIEGENVAEASNTYSLLAGILFWFSAVSGAVTQGIVGYRLKAWIKANRARRVLSSKRIGIIAFFQNSYATVADIATVVGVVGLTASVIITNGTGYSCYAFLAELVFSFSMHCILNGKAFYVLQNKKNIQHLLKHARTNLNEN